MSRKDKHGHGLNAERIARKRNQLRNRDGDNCWLCGEIMTFPGESLPQDHRGSPLFFGTKRPRYEAASLDRLDPKGFYTLDNLRLAHKTCNGWRGDTPVEALGAHWVSKGLSLFAKKERQLGKKQRTREYFAAGNKPQSKFNPRPPKWLTDEINNSSRSGNINEV